MTYFDAPHRPADLTLNSDSINNSLVGFWPLTDGSGTSAVDVSTGGNNGMQSGGVSWASSEIGTVASFDGSNDQFDISHNSSYNAGTTGELTVTAWAKFDTFGTYRVIVSKDYGYSSGAREWLIYGELSGNRVSAQLFNSSGTAYSVGTGVNTINTGVWYFLSMVWDGTDLKLFVDGSVASTASAAITPRTSTEDVQIGYNGRFRHDGDVQNVRIFNAALTATQVEQLYTRPWTGTNYDTEALWLSPPASPTLSTASESTSIMADIEGWWVMTDGSGTTLTDISGNSRDATLYGTNTWETETLGTVNFFDNTSSIGSHAEVSATPPDLTSAFTWSSWNKLDPSTNVASNKYGAGFAITNSSGSSDIEVYFNSNASWSNQKPQVFFNRSNGGTSSSMDHGVSVGLAYDEWEHWVVVYDGSNTKAYRNGTLINSRSVTNSPLLTSGYKLSLNGLSNPSLYSSISLRMQNSRLWSRALSDSEISTLYERPWIGAEYNETAPLYPPVPSSLTPLDSSNSILVDQVGWWPLTETDDFASGAADISGNSNNGTPQSNAGSSNTALGQVLEQPDANSYISVGDVSALKITGALSISIWLKTDSSTPVNIVSKYHATSGGRAYSLHLNRPELEFNINGTTVAQGTTQIRGDDEWHHLVGVYDPSNFIRVYVDGVLDGEVTTGVPSSITDTSYPFNIGRAWNGGNVVGFLQNARVWSRALSATEVADIYYSPWLGSAYTGTSSDPATNRYFSPAAFARLG